MKLTQSDLDKMNLELIPGTVDQYRRKKTALQPREVISAKKAESSNSMTFGLEFNNKPIIKDTQLRKVKITLFGEPMPKQSALSYATGAKSKSGKYIISHYQPAKKEERVKDYQFQLRKQLPPEFKMFESRVHITKMHFIFSPLKSFHKNKGKMDAIRRGEIFYKETHPDLPDNLKKLVNDSMNGIVYKDDSIIVSEDNVKKYYGVGGCIIIEMEGY